MKIYELTCLISPDLSEKDLMACQEKIVTLIEEEGGILIEGKSPIKKILGYPIKKKQTAFLTTLNFQFWPEELEGKDPIQKRLENIEKKLKSESKILRYLILAKKLPKKIAEISIKKPKEITKLPRKEKILKPKVEKVELKEIEKKIEEILGE
jgi:small subunit ribosomal protein S6